MMRLLIQVDAKKKVATDGEIVQGDSLSKDARLEVLSGVLSQIERSYGKGAVQPFIRKEERREMISIYMRMKLWLTYLFYDLIVFFSAKPFHS